MFIDIDDEMGIFEEEFKQAPKLSKTVQKLNINVSDQVYQARSKLIHKW